MNSKNIEEIKFSKSMSGYRIDEVEDFCDKVQEDYIKYEEALRQSNARIAELENQLKDNEASAESINTVLISAQKLADSIISDAKKQAEEIVSNAETEAETIKQRTKKALEEIDAVITEQKNAASAEVEKMLKEAARKSEGMILAAKDSVAREQMLFDKLKSEVASFKSDIKTAYKTHLEALSALPEEVPVNPEQASLAIEEIISREPNLYDFIERPEVTVEPTVEEEEICENTTEEPADNTEEELKEVVEDMAAGFIVTPIED